MRNPFKALTEEEKIGKQVERAALEAKLKGLAALGNKCLSNPDFTKYRDELILQKDDIIKTMIASVNPDPVQDAYFLRACLNKLSAYYELLELPKDDAARKAI